MNILNLSHSNIASENLVTRPNSQVDKNIKLQNNFLCQKSIQKYSVRIFHFNDKRKEIILHIYSNELENTILHSDSE